MTEGQKATGVKSVQVLGELAQAMARVIQKGRKLYTLTSDDAYQRISFATCNWQTFRMSHPSSRAFAFASPRQNWR